MRNLSEDKKLGFKKKNLKVLILQAFISFSCSSSRARWGGIIFFRKWIFLLAKGKIQYIRVWK